MQREKIVIPAAGAPPTLRMDLLGQAEVWLSEVALAGQLPGKALALLAYLALSGRPHPRPALAALLWSETDDQDALASLRQALTRLRRVAEPYLEISRQTVAFRPGPDCRIDAEQFLACTAEIPAPLDAAAAVRLGDAVARYRGELLHGLSVREAPLFEEWLAGQREHLRERAIAALQALLGYHAARGAGAAARDYGQRLLQIDPWREEVYRALMLLAAREGRRSSALALFESCRRTLGEQLGVDPSEETAALYRQIRDGQIEQEAPPQRQAPPHEPAPAAPRHNLPPQPNAFIGRLAELDDIQRLLARPECRLVSVVGMGGAGKTRLALEAAREHLCAFRDGVFFVPLAAVRTAEQAAGAVCQALALELDPQADPRAALLAALAPRQTLLVLDNLEHLLDECGLIVAMLEAAPELRLLVTSRERLELRWEWTVDLEGLECPPDPPARPLADYSAAQLFLERAAQVRRPFAPDKGEQPAVAQICRLTAGLPLLLELAAAALRERSCITLAAALADSLHALETRLRDLPPRHRSVQAVLDHSWELLDAQERRVFCALAVFRQEIDAEAAAQVAGTTPTLLERLAAKSLLRQIGQGRYALHSLVRQYAAARLEQRGEAQALQAAHCDYYTALAHAAFAELGGPQQQVWLERLERAHPNLRAALQWAIDRGDAARAQGLAGRLGRFWHLRNHFAEGRRWLRAALALGSDEGRRTEDEDSAGDQRLTTNDQRSASDEGRRKEDEGGAAGGSSSSIPNSQFSILNSQFRAQAFYSAGVLAHSQGDYAEARACFAENMALQRALGDRRGLAVALNSLGGMAVTFGDDAAAEGYFSEALALHQELGEQVKVGAVLGNLGAVAVRRGDYELGERRLAQSLELARRHADRRGVTVILFNLGDVALLRGDHSGAAQRLGEALRGYRTLGDRLGLAECLELIGRLEAARGRPAGLARLCGAADALREQIAAPVGPEHRAAHERALRAAQTALSEAAWLRAWTAGRALDLEQAVAEALALLPP
jgi:predicted ATPase/DNA-binding SARP family transcriptional activator